MDEAHRAGVKVRVAPKTTELLTQRAQYVPGQGVPLFELRPPAFAGTDFAVKRSFDIVVSSVLIVVGLPIWLLIAAAIKLTSRGPVFYRDPRIGLGEREFGMLKFRTMVADAPARQRELERANEAGGALFKIRDDPRVTTIGRLLRRFSIDEIPQVLNVLHGRDEPRRPAAAAGARLRAARGLAPPALPRAARDDRPVADLRTLEPHLRRPRPPRLLLPRELVDLARHLDPREDRARGRLAPRRVLSAGPRPRLPTNLGRVKTPKIVAVASAADLDFRYGCTPAWWQLWKGMHDVGVDLIVTPYRGKAIETPWWRAAPNPLYREAEAFARAGTPSPGSRGTIPATRRGQPGRLARRQGGARGDLART